jgi:hypothetical protein
VANDSLERGPSAQDGDRINIHEEHEVRFWMNALHCTRDALVETVRRVGVMAEDVRQLLAQQRYS